MTGIVLDPAEVIDASPVSRFQKRVVVLCALVAGVEGFSTIGASFASPVLAREWGLRDSTLGLFFSAGLVGLMLGAFLLAPRADRIGRKLILVACPVLFGLGGLAMAASPNLPVLFAACFVTGAGSGGAMPNVIAVASEFAPRRVRSFMVMLAFSGFIVGSILSGAAAARLIGAYGWRAIFVASGILPLLVAPFVALFLLSVIPILGAALAASGLRIGAPGAGRAVLRHRP